MSASVEKTGRSVEEAIQEGLRELGVGREQVDVEIVEEGSRGLFRLFPGKEARVRLTVRKTKEEIAREFLERVLGAMGVSYQGVEVDRNSGVISVSVEAKEAGVLIGRRGQTLDALEYLINVAAGRGGRSGPRISVDVGGYRRQREEKLKRLAERLAKKVKSSGRSIALRPMSSQDRRVIHLALQNDPEVITRSEGEEPFRKVIIACRK